MQNGGNKTELAKNKRNLAKNETELSKVYIIGFWITTVVCTWCILPWIIQHYLTLKPDLAIEIVCVGAVFVFDLNAVIPRCEGGLFSDMMNGAASQCPQASDQLKNSN